ncbi:hypothetical protein ACIQRS_10140 [Streptomyces termitum]|uniref:Lipoprotein n=1 Tax=Streptomyces termitum TaxID=67368 RepID=A0A918SUF6_9ACTN|nr:hypothetical protein [Streptomyces termitum]GHA68076.1 hypothetical protein GCM10010305_07530 [Streptomyces termitum]
MTRRAARLALCAAGLLALAGCGIRGSDVVEAGGAPTVVVAPFPESRLLLYFLGPDGRLMPVSRDVGRIGVPVPTRSGPGGDPDAATGETVPFDGFGQGYEIDAGHPYAAGIAPAKALAALFAGPRPPERAAGLTTALPPDGLRAAQVRTDGPDGLLIRVGFPVRSLPPGAVGQLVCTMAFSADRSGTARVTVTGTDGSLPASSCEV